MNNSKTKTTFIATILGYFALVFWSLDPTLYTELRGIPIFEIISFCFLLVFIYTSLKLTVMKQWHRVKQPWYIWLLGVFGIYVNNVVYVSAFKYAPPAQSMILVYLWPMFALIFSSLVNRERLRYNAIFALALGFGSIIVINYHHHAFSFQEAYWRGYFFATLDAIIWSTYIVISRRLPSVPVEMIGMYCGIGAAISLGVHFSTEPTVIPSLFQFSILLTTGVLSQACAYYFWQFGIQQGNFSFLNIVSYTSPTLATIFLILVGLAKPTMNLFIACAMVTTASLLAENTIWKKIRRKKAISRGVQTSRQSPSH